MQEKQLPGYLDQTIEALSNEALSNQGILYDDLIPKLIKSLGLENEPQITENHKLYTFLESHPLTITETKVFILAVKGFSNEGIAKHLFVSKNTIKYHLKHIYRKTAIKNRTALIKLGAKLGI
ncbi:MAG: helix-turn-helix transcriptional regulator [Actinomycetota bacterium]